ncbi:hypothetical protein HH308_05060 [Gordonia sp. TBRC 11910]|uniref:Minor capsid protein 2 n=1 Tax=Gordonia asplenii TaxID=2725283 RepID=A0A848KVV5_9ACTN|nr:phage minor capsid protein [Gordonia asplenii]NMO00583.1 hypothetical protein [Gordonia asplenii]
MKIVGDVIVARAIRDDGSVSGVQRGTNLLLQRPEVRRQTAQLLAQERAQEAAQMKRDGWSTVVINDRSDAVRRAVPQVLRSTDDIYRRVVQQVMSQPLTTTTEDERLAAVQRALDKFASRGITAFVDERGRRWGLDSYLEMATRTAVARASIDVFAADQQAQGRGLALVSQHVDCAPQCAPYQGRVLSLSGATTGDVRARDGQVPVVASLAEARARGFGHPGCRHYLLPWAEGDEYVEPRPVDPQAYRDSQELRRRERAVRAAQLEQARAITRPARGAARRRVAAAQKAMYEHARAAQIRTQQHRTVANGAR